MAEPAATITVAACAATGAVLFPILCQMGINPVSMGAGLWGCVAMQLLLQSEPVRIKRIVAVTTGSVLAASAGTPLAVLWAAKMGIFPAGTTPEIAQATIAFAIGFLAKPAATVAMKKLRAMSTRWVGKDAR